MAAPNGTPLSRIETAHLTTAGIQSSAVPLAFRSPIRFAQGAQIQPAKSSCCFGILSETRSSPERTLKLSSRRGQISRGYRRQWSSSPRQMENDVCKFSYLDAHRPSKLTSLTEDTKFPIEDANDHSFVNQGAIIWTEMRRQWVGDSSKTCRRMPSEPSICWFSTYDDLLSTTQPFPQPIPLSEMVDFLVDFWHEEGLYD